MKQYFLISLPLLILFVLLSLTVSTQVLQLFDYQSTIFLQKILPDFAITPFSIFSIIGTAEIATVFFLVLWFIIPILRKVYVLPFYAVTAAVEIIGKSIISQIPPPVELLKTNLHVGFPSESVSSEFFSYPSGHLARTAFISAILLFVIWKNSKLTLNQKYALVFLILTFDLFMFVSRVYLGEHWTTDVVGGALLGFGLGFLCFGGWRKFFRFSV